MALATQCPHCHTTFRVAHDQLKLRAGLVRCGACKQIFNGIENLLRPEELDPPALPPQTPPPPEFASTAPPPLPTPEPEPRPELEAEASETIEHVAVTADATLSATEPAPADEDKTDEEVPAQEEPAKTDDPLLRMTLMDIAHQSHQNQDEDEDLSAESAPSPASQGNGQSDDQLGQVIDDLRSKPWRSKPDASAEADALDRQDAEDFEEPAFVRQGRRRQRVGRAIRIVMVVGSLLLLITLLAQAVFVFRDQIAARFPDARPLLTQMCSQLGCQVGLPAHIDLVAIESSELQTLAANANTFTLSVLLRNHGETAQAWPSIELTMNDANDKPVVRKIFTPREYLTSAQDLNKGFAAKSEQPVKLSFELTQLKASGYRVYLFYP